MDVGESPSVPVWEVYPFRLALSCSEHEFHKERARIRLQAGYKGLDLVVSAMGGNEAVESAQ